MGGAGGLMGAEGAGVSTWVPGEHTPVKLMPSGALLSSLLSEFQFLN